MAARKSKNDDAEKTDATEPETNAETVEPTAAPAQPPQVQIRMDEREMRASYANGFRTNTTADEVIVDFGLNLPIVAGQTEGPQEFLLKLDTRVIMNHYSAKRLAITLGQLIQRHEQQFGELELDVAKRQVPTT